jgi:hypothetical protein
MITRRQRLAVVLCSTLLVLAAACARNPSNYARAFGLADDAMRGFVIIFNRGRNPESTSVALTRIATIFDRGLASVATTVGELPPKVRSGFTGIVCQTLAYRASHTEWPDEQKMEEFAVAALAGLSDNYDRREFGKSALSVAFTIAGQSEFDQKAVNDVVCAAVAFPVSR